MSKIVAGRAPESVNPPPHGLDQIDEDIISELQQDGRRSYRDIARNLGLSESLVRWRTQRLLRNGVVRILAITDPFRLGYQILATIVLTVEPSARSEVAARLVELPEILYVASCVGRADLLIEVVCRNHEDLVTLLSETMGSLKGITATETFMELKIHKFSYTHPASHFTQGAPADTAVAEAANRASRPPRATRIAGS
jgi:Lrp/AsnC family transcriptional regulator for asnA, asnC and gidA